MKKIDTDIHVGHDFELPRRPRDGFSVVDDKEEIYRVIDDGSKRYKGVIPSDCYHEPYMSMEELEKEMERMSFFGYRKGVRLLGVMARERIGDVTLIRHAYVLTSHQSGGTGSQLLAFIENQVDTEWLFVGTWKAATWAIDFYRKFCFTLMDNKDVLLRRYWDVSERQIETSCVLAKRMNPWHRL